MLWNAKNGCVRIDDMDMYYVSFGKGTNNLIMLPGLGDGLTTVKGIALPMSMAYRMYANDYKVFIFSRKNDLEEGYSTRDMARDQAEAMKMLGIKSANILGISQGGMIAQYLAIDYPDLVVLAVLVGIPMYADIFGTIPIAEALLAKGALLGTVLSFMMAVTTLSLPSMIMLRKAVKPKLLGLFIGICTIGIIVVGYFFNAFQYLLI